jgi:hypothetical protein
LTALLRERKKRRKKKERERVSEREQEGAVVSRGSERGVMKTRTIVGWALSESFSVGVRTRKEKGERRGKTVREASSGRKPRKGGAEKGETWKGNNLKTEQGN